MREEFSRTAALFGEAAIARLADKRVAVFGLGGVGGYAVEALARAGVGALDLIDNDTVSLSNINRQLLALHSTVGQPKTAVAAARVRDIFPDCTVRTWELFYSAETADSMDLSVYDYVVDAIDTVSAKLELVSRCAAVGVPIISCMGTGNKLDPTQFEVADISKTSVCPLAKVMRVELRRRGITHLPVVYSREQPQKRVADEAGGRHAPASAPFVPGAAGLLLAGEVIQLLINE
ncbi:MAG: tRNA threonylcarbamoyladenosine dehydratase [Clostridia bacterium]|nr:tRNA threonylcarbamoyladenosine dehydratase [Clostridia bacterium]